MGWFLHNSRLPLQKGLGAERRTVALRMSTTEMRPDLVTMMIEADDWRVRESRFLY